MISKLYVEWHTRCKNYRNISHRTFRLKYWKTPQITSKRNKKRLHTL